MAICVVVLADQAAADQLSDQLNDPQLRLSRSISIPPEGDSIDRIELLSPNITR